MSEQGSFGIGWARRQFKIHFLAGNDLRRLRVKQLYRAVGSEQAFQQAQAVRHARSAGEGEADRFRHVEFPMALIQPVV